MDLHHVGREGVACCVSESRGVVVVVVGARARFEKKNGLFARLLRAFFLNLNLAVSRTRRSERVSA